MAPDDITENHDVVVENDLDPDLVCRIIEDKNDPRDDDYDVAERVAEMLDISRDDAYDLVRDWREPDWPITVEKRLKYHSEDQYNDWAYNYRGYTPYKEVFPRGITVEWEVDKTEGQWSDDIEAELISVAGYDVSDDE